MDIGIGATRWPVFNVADSAITVGVILWVLVIYLDGRKRDKEKPESNLSPPPTEDTLH
ncbi:signal peptidase II [candidate division KSB1 bacterium]